MVNTIKFKLREDLFMILHILQILKNFSLFCFLTQEFCDLRNLRILDIAGNVIQIFPPGVSRVNFYYN